MAVSRTKKESILSTLENHLKEAKSLVFTSNQRVTVDEITKMKRELRTQNVTYMLAKKTLMRIAFKNVYSLELDLDTLPWQVALAIAKDDPIIALTIINRYAKEWKKDEKILFIASYIEGKLLWKDDTMKLASLPSREVLLARLLGSMMSPLSGLARFFDGARKELELRDGKILKELIEDAGWKNPEKELSNDASKTEKMNGEMQEEKREDQAEEGEIGKVNDPEEVSVSSENIEESPADSASSENHGTHPESEEKK